MLKEFDEKWLRLWWDLLTFDYKRIRASLKLLMRRVILLEITSEKQEPPFNLISDRIKNWDVAEML